MKRRNRSAVSAFLASPISLLVLAVLAYSLGRAAWSMHEKARDSGARLDIARAETAELEESQADLSARIERLSTPAGVRAELREKYRAVEQGEQVAVIVEAPAEAGTAASADAAAGERRGIFGAFLRLFGL